MSKGRNHRERRSTYSNSTYSNSGQSNYPRTSRINQVLRQLIAQELERLADSDERLCLLTVTAVETSPDLRSAVVYLSSMSDQAALALDERHGHLQRYLGSEVRMKRTPRLRFEVDPAVVEGSKIDNVLRRIADSPSKIEPSIDLVEDRWRE